MSRRVHQYLGKLQTTMLEKPDIQDQKIISSIREKYGFSIKQINFLPLGADINAAVYRALAEDGSAYFVKLRRGVFDEIAVTLPKFLSEKGIKEIIAPLETKTGELWTHLEEFKVVLYPFVEGKDAYTVKLLDRHWTEFGKALRRIHNASVPSEIVKRLPKEDYSPQWRESVKDFLGKLDEPYTDAVAIKLASYLKSKAKEVRDLLERAERLATKLRTRSLEHIVCHSDLHAGNFLIAKDAVLYIVDWDNPILAPKERDLMFVGGGLGGASHTPQQEEQLFYQGYGETKIDYEVLAYYRYERIIRDIAEFCEQIFLTDDGGADREQSLHYLASFFLAGSVLDIAYKSDMSREKI